MTNAFVRSWEITKLSFDVIKKDKELIGFPILAGIFSLIYLIAMIFPSIISQVLKGVGIDKFGSLEYIMVFLTYLGLAFIATFFNVCVVYTTKTRFAGGNATFGESISYAFSKTHLILSWSLLSATVGLLMNVIDQLAEKLGAIGEMVVKILNSLLGMIWSIITIFVVPGMVYHDLGPIEAIKKSVEVLKKTWGESLIRYYGLGLVSFLFVFIGVVVGIFLTIGLSGLGIWGIVAGVGLTVAYVILVVLIFGIANTIFNTALFVYADTGKLPQGYTQEVMQGAFRQKPKRGMF